jgi:hypothetical protein
VDLSAGESSDDDETAFRRDIGDPFVPPKLGWRYQ